MVEITITKHSYNGDAADTTFPYDFRIDHKSHLKVWVDGVLKTEGTHYTVSGVGEDAGGTVTFVTAPPAGTGNVIVQRISPQKQLLELPSEGPFRTEDIEDKLDDIVMMIQELQTKFGTAVANKSVKWDSLAQDLTTQPGVYEMFLAQAVAEGETFEDVTFTIARADTSYMVLVQANWNTTWWIPNAQKATTGFRISFNTPPGPSAAVNVMVFS